MPRQGQRYVIVIMEDGRNVFSAGARLQMTETDCMFYIKSEKSILWNFVREPTRYELECALSRRRFVHDLILFKRDFNREGVVQLDLGKDIVLVASPV